MYIHANRFMGCFYVSALRGSSRTTLACLMILCFSETALASEPFRRVMSRLIRDGYDTAMIQKYYSDSRCEFLPAIAQINLKHEEDTAAYRSFLEEKNISIAREYLNRNRALLGHFEQKTGVPAGIVTAILLIETKCGLDRDKAPVFNVLSTIAASSESGELKKSFDALKVQYPDVTMENVRRRSRSRSRWAYKELRAFIDWHRRNSREDILSVRGSWAGALGLPQFMPTSLRAFGADGDGDGHVDLHSDTDAVASVCNYLRKNGWKYLRSAWDQRKIIWRYNHSPLYVDTVLDVSERISQ